MTSTVTKNTTHVSIGGSFANVLRACCAKVVGISLARDARLCWWNWKSIWSHKTVYCYKLWLNTLGNVHTEWKIIINNLIQIYRLTCWFWIIARRVRLQWMCCTFASIRFRVRDSCTMCYIVRNFLKFHQRDHVGKTRNKSRNVVARFIANVVNLMSR